MLCVDAMDVRALLSLRPLAVWAYGVMDGKFIYPQERSPTPGYRFFCRVSPQPIRDLRPEVDYTAGLFKAFKTLSKRL